jgi:opacity protein-like surface antigen
VYSSPLSNSANFYLVGGVGVYDARGKNSEFPNAEVGPHTLSSTNFGFNTGVGVNFKLGSHAGFVEARYHDLIGSKSFEANGVTSDQPDSFQIVPISVGFVL